MHSGQSIIQLTIWNCYHLSGTFLLMLFYIRGIFVVQTSLLTIDNKNQINFDNVLEDPFWNVGTQRDLKMHHIHSYPAKFPAFITEKALEYAQRNSLNPKRIADVFCGCGTVAFEAKRNNISFWGCDINPVATMIAKAKSQHYELKVLEKYYNGIMEMFQNCSLNISYSAASERIKYWYDEEHYIDLYKLKSAIYEVVPIRSKYFLFFICAFSNILKQTSRWLTKSIKPQIDPNKKPSDVINAFIHQYNFMVEACVESNNVNRSNTSSRIVTNNFLNKKIKIPKVEMIITSPPYVTSYEYADLHQLSSLWLDFTDDYRSLRAGSIGSLHHDYNFNKELKKINSIGSSIVFRLMDKDKGKAKSVARYFLDMQLAAKRCYDMLSENGAALFVIGNTEYKNIRIENAQHLTESLLNSGFKEVLVTKRKISKKILTPYRDESGKFTTDKNSRKVYSEEFILIGRK